jgi:hypothetical protein
MKPHRFIAALAALFAAVSSHAGESSLESDFKNPPVKTRPYVWWHWMGSNFSKEGITRDLEAMKASGIGGATIFNIASAVQESHKPTLNNPWPDQTYRSPKYWEAMRHAAAEAQRLGLEIGLHNTVGYSTTGGPWIDEEKNMQNLVTKSITVDGGKRISVEIPRPDPTSYRGWGGSGLSFNFFRDIAILAVPASGDIDPSKIIDLTKSFKQGRLDWDAPEGKWQVFRLAHAPTGANPHPLPDELIGKTLEVDKLSRDLNRFHWDQVIEPMKEHLGPYLGKSMKHFLIDSYEAGAQNWTPAFREEFQKRKGYDPLPWLVTRHNRTVGDGNLSERFKWDQDDVIHTLFHENGWMTGHDKMKAVGMDLQFEPYGGQFDTVEGTALADLPMGEFWTGGGGSISSVITASARAAGRTVVGAEAFTGPPTLSKWSETPGFLKRSADGTFASGANRLILHHWVHQPFDDRYKPGMGMGWWGTHFNRHQTWAKDGTAFYQYLGRTQALLQSGETPSDFVSVGKSQGSDIISWREFREGVKVRDGRIVLSSGRSYPFLGIPHDGMMSPGDVKKIEALLEQGAVIVCSKPSGAPGLAGYPQSDAEVKASTLWNDGPVRAVGKGKLYTKGDTGAAVSDFKITPMIRFPGASGVSGTARQTRDETLFFVANTTPKTNTFTASFRVKGLRPELWDAETGSIRFAPVWRQKDGRTEVDLTLDTYRSIFVVFRDAKLPADHVVSVVSQSAGDDSLEIVKARFGAAAGNRWMDVTDKLKELSDNGALQIASIHPGVFGDDPAPNVVKQLELEYRLKGKSLTATVDEGKPLDLGTPSTAAKPALTAAADGSVTVSSTTATRAELVFASGKRQPITLAAPVTPVTIKGPWTVVLDSPVEAKQTLPLPELVNLADHEASAVKYFSGTATYSKKFEMSDLKSQIILDLGTVRDLARVTLNGKDLGVLWQAPFKLDITSALKTGGNLLEIAVTNTWHNRLVGDEQFPADFEWGEDRGEKGHAMKSYPDWFIKNQPRPEQGRKCFVVWYYHRKDTPLLPAGLIGPVQLIPASQTNPGR